MIDRAKLTIWLHEIFEGLTRSEICALLKYRHGSEAAGLDDEQLVVMDGVLTDWTKNGLLTCEDGRYSLRDPEGLMKELGWIEEAWQE